MLAPAPGDTGLARRTDCAVGAGTAGATRANQQAGVAAIAAYPTSAARPDPAGVAAIAAGEPAATFAVDDAAVAAVG